MIKPEPPVSVVIPTFNRVKKVVHAIDSVLGQTYPSGSRELIVVDDGSSDKTCEVLNARYGSQIRLLRQSNAGPSAARNLGIEAAAHEIVAFLDSDDRWMPEKLEHQVPALSLPGVVLSYTNWSEQGRDPLASRFHDIDLHFESDISVLDDPMRTLLRPGGSGIWTSTCMVSKRVMRRCGQFDERMRLGEDLRLWLRMSGEGKFAAVSNPLVERGAPGDDNLIRPGDPQYNRDSSSLRLEIFWEAYARSGDAEPAVRERLRHFVVRSLYEQSVCYSASQEYSKARRKAIEALAFAPKGEDLLKILIYVIAPTYAGMIRGWRHPDRYKSTVRTVPSQSAL